MPSGWATAPPCATRISASGRAGPGASSSRKSARWRSACRRSGLSHGDKIAVIGANRPRLYWTFAAAQSLGAVPVPVYADAVAEEMAYVLDHAGVRFAVVQDQEQVDKIRSSAATIPTLSDIIYDEPRGLDGYDHRPARLLRRPGKGRGAACSRSARLRARWEAGIRDASGDDISVMLYTSGTTGRSKGVMIKAASAVNAARDTAEFDRLDENDSVLAYLPLAWVGDHYLNYAQGYVSGFCMNCPESAETVRRTCARSARPSISRRRASSKACSPASPSAWRMPAG